MLMLVYDLVVESPPLSFVHDSQFQRKILQLAIVSAKRSVNLIAHEVSSTALRSARDGYSD
jgi:hypothetical protein